MDGLDVEAVASAFGHAVERARRGEGPSIVEATCYRFRGHFEGDADMYRSQAEKDARRAQDPIYRTRATVMERQLASEAELDAEWNAIRDAMAQMLASVRSDSMPAAERARDHVFAE